jgi:hypothetical protein
MSQGLCPNCGAAVDMHSDHNGDVCGKCGRIVKFRVHVRDGRLVFSAGALDFFTIELNEVKTYDKTQGFFHECSLGELESILSALDEQIAEAAIGTGHATNLKESKRAVKDLISARKQAL